MPLTPQDIARLAQLARLELSAAEGTRMCSHLNDFFSLVEKMQAVDTDGIEPLTHPVAVVQDVALQLAEDHIGQGASAARRQAMQANAPQVERGLFLVPKVIE